MTEPSWQDLYDVGKATLQTRRPRLKVVEGDVTDAILAGCASMGMAILAYANNRFRACFLDGAEDADLTALAHDRGVDRDEGDFSIGYVTISRPTFSAGLGTIPAGTRVATSADSSGAFQIFTIDTDVVFGATDLVKTSVSITASKNGVLGNVRESTVTRFLDTPVFDPSFVVVNPQITAGGAEAESDDELRDRVRNFFLTQARGTILALIFGARQVPGVDRVTVVVDDAGVVTVYVADVDGNSNDAMVAAVQVELQNWRDAADIVNASAGVLVSQSVVLSLTVKTGTDVNALLTLIRQAVVSRIALLNPGETLYRDMISAAVRDVDRQNITGVDVVIPVANISPTSNQLIRTDAGSISFA